MEAAADAILQAAGHMSSQEDLSDVDIEGDGSSSLSDIEDKDVDQDEDGELSDELSNPSEEDNDSEAETERLEDSPNKFRPHRDVVLNSHNASQIYERSPSKLYKQVTVGDLEEDDDDDPLSDDDLSINESVDSPKSSVHENAEVDPSTAPTSLGDGAAEARLLLSVGENDSKKRKRSIMAGSSLDVDLEEPLRKRTGSIMAPVNDYAIEDDTNAEDEAIAEDEIEQSNPQSGNISDEDDGEAPDEELQVEPAQIEDDPEVPDAPPSPKRRGRRKKKGVDNGIVTETSVNPDPTDADTPSGDQNVDADLEDEADANARNEEERKWFSLYLSKQTNLSIVERKRLAFEQLGAIEKRFALLKERYVTFLNAHTPTDR